MVARQWRKYEQNCHRNAPKFDKNSRRKNENKFTTAQPIKSIETSLEQNIYTNQIKEVLGEEMQLDKEMRKAWLTFFEEPQQSFSF